MRGTLILFVTLLLSLKCMGQQFEVRMPHKHIDKLESIGNPAHKLRKYKRLYHRDSVRQARQYDRMLDRVKSIQTTSISGIQDSLQGFQATDSLQQLADKIQPLSQKYNEAIDDIKEKSVALNKTVGNISGSIPTLPSELKVPDIPEIDVPNIPAAELSSVIPDTQFAQLPNVPDANDIVAKGQSVVTDNTQLKEYSGILNEYNDPMHKLGNDFGIPNEVDSTYIKEQLRKKAEEKFMEFLESNQSVIRGVQEKASFLMKKYSVVPNSNDLSTATKRTSMKGKALGQRMVVGLNLQFLSTSPLILDCSPTLGYRFNTKWIAGVGVNYRFSSSTTDSVQIAVANTFGVRLFSQYEVLRSFNGYVEYGRYHSRSKNSESGKPLPWEDTFIVGVSRRMAVHKKVDMTVLVGYNFLHKNSSFNPSPFVVRVGFDTNQFAFLSKKEMKDN